MRSYIKREVKSGSGKSSDEALLEFARTDGATIFHPSSTCKMGHDGDTRVVVDARMRVSGVSGLRVVDGSAMPTLISGNTHAPIVMMAEKPAELNQTEETWVE